MAESEGNLHRARHAVCGAVNAPALAVERWILQANASDRASVKVSELRALLDAIKGVALVAELGMPAKASSIAGHGNATAAMNQLQLLRFSLELAFSGRAHGPMRCDPPAPLEEGQPTADPASDGLWTG